MLRWVACCSDHFLQYNWYGLLIAHTILITIYHNLIVSILFGITRWNQFWVISAMLHFFGCGRRQRHHAIVVSHLGVETLSWNSLLRLVLQCSLLGWFLSAFLQVNRRNHRTFLTDELTSHDFVGEITGEITGIARSFWSNLSIREILASDLFEKLARCPQFLEIISWTCPT